MHKLLAEQIAKAKTEAGSVDLDRLIGLVGRAYQEFDRDRRRSDRKLSLMIAEIGTVQRDLERLVAERTEEVHARESDLNAQNMRFNAAVSNMSQGLVMFDGDSHLVICNSRYAEMYRLRPDDVRPGLTLRQLLQRRAAAGSFSGDVDQYLDGLSTAVKEGTTTSQFVELDDGRTIAVVNVPMPGGGWVATHEDITERRRSEMQIAHMARHDALTDLPNRVLLRDRLAEALIHVERGQRLAVLCLDLDHFKNVNDSLGHPLGDELLRAVASRLRGCIRETDTISRVGGDEFSIIQTDINDATDAERLALRLSEVIAAPYEPSGPHGRGRHQHRHCGGPCRRDRRQRASQERRHGALRREGGRPWCLSFLRAEHGRAHEGATRARARAPQGAGERRIRIVLPAGGEPRRRNGAVLRGAVAVEPSSGSRA